MASHAKEVRKLVEEVEERGWRADPIKDGWQLKHPDGKGMVTVHKTPSSSRSIPNYRAAIKRIERQAEER
jgi:hypothetical protein